MNVLSLKKNHQTCSKGVNRLSLPHAMKACWQVQPEETGEWFTKYLHRQMPIVLFEKEPKSTIITDHDNAKCRSPPTWCVDRPRRLSFGQCCLHLGRSVRRTKSPGLSPSWSSHSHSSMPGVSYRSLKWLDVQFSANTTVWRLFPRGWFTPLLVTSVIFRSWLLHCLVDFLPGIDYIGMVVLRLGVWSLKYIWGSWVLHPLFGIDTYKTRKFVIAVCTWRSRVQGKIWRMCKTLRTAGTICLPHKCLHKPTSGN